MPSSGEQKVAEIGLGAAIAALREELTVAKGTGEGSYLRFGVGPVSLELETVVTVDVTGKVGWKILEAGASRESARTQKISLTLTPEWWDAAGQAYTTDFLIAGEVDPGPAANTDAKTQSSVQTDDEPEDE